ncbi:MAG: DUF2855 family protein, partial [Phenylobacterium sp.]|nr:DUF2855 family protein [Phenylobacterium sp.]
VVAAIDAFALTANNTSYWVAGESLGYWRFYPCAEGWAIIPVWGFATVIASRAEGVEVGERIWGFLPMASHVVLRPADVTPRGFSDGAPHRQGLADVYNSFLRTRTDPPELAGLDVERSALVPVFTTSFIIDDFLADNGWFGGKQVLILSASSKTGFGLADLIHRREGRPVQVVGATSAGNRDFVSQLGGCDTVIAYDDIERLDPSVPTVVVDMAGSTDIRGRVHRHFADRLVYSCIVGVTHWQDRGQRVELPGAKPTFFFAPGQIAKREQDWGPGEVRRRAQVEALRIARETARLRTVETVRGVEPSAAAWADLVAGRVPPERVLMLSLNAEARP